MAGAAARAATTPRTTGARTWWRGRYFMRGTPLTNTHGDDVSVLWEHRGVGLDGETGTGGDPVRGTSSSCRAHAMHMEASHLSHCGDLRRIRFDVRQSQLQGHRIRSLAVTDRHSNP